jgi:hypothetical protein
MRTYPSLLHTQGTMDASRTQGVHLFRFSSKVILRSFLYADPTPNALQVFVPRTKPGTAAADLTGLPAEHGNEKGIWITADPIPGCVVCNIGESELFCMAVDPARLIF